MPKKIKVTSVVKSRYSELNEETGLIRPTSWDARSAGQELILDEAGQEIKLNSLGGQSTPQEGWELMLIAGDNEQGYEWTLYAI